MDQQKVVISQHLEQSLSQVLAECSYDRLFVLVDETTEKCCLPVLSSHLSSLTSGFSIIRIGTTDQHKTLDSLSHVWSELQRMGATRHSLMINLGGGMVTDLGGFAASTFKRGIHYINIPTTLLSMVDASVILDTTFLKTLDQENILSGYAEMLKHALISDEKMWTEHILYSPLTSHLSPLTSMIAQSVAVKQRIVTEDPTEQGLRKALNLGHTAGHAFESLALERTPILHGYAVAYGLVVELYLSCVKTGFPTDKMRQTVQFIKEHYGKMTVTCDDYPHLLELMPHDKKNVGTTINFTLLADVGNLCINQTATEEEIREALDFYREN